MPIRYALSNSFGFGGTNGSLLFKKFEEDDRPTGDRGFRLVVRVSGSVSP